jgi:predicted unusual protein kinase regulating ubiquinone biosynthesis (AarF/ABC1/UbiB family)
VPQDDKPPVGGSRFLKLAGMTAAAAGGYARHRVKRLFQGEAQALEDHQQEMTRIGARIASTLGELKGAAMKMGQMASLASDLLPQELAAALQSLQKEAPPVDFSVIEAQIEAEFDQPLARLFDEFDPVPFASASIGQVHRARVDGRDAICKVQYPGVDAAIDSDMRHLKLALLASGLIRVDKRALDATFQEIRARMHEELDYCNESDNVREFRAFHRRHPFVVVPEVIGHRSAKRVLTLAYVAGDHASELDGLGYTAEQRDLCGTNLWRAMESEIFDHGAFHADPNQANFAFRKDGTIVIYDFGCVKRLAAGIADSCRELVLHNLREDYPAVERAAVALGIRRMAGPPVPHEFYKRWRDWLALPILAADTYDFGSSRFAQDALALIGPDSLKYLGSFQPSSHMVFLNRTLAGHHATLRRIRARLRVGFMMRTRMPELAPWFPAE